MTAYTPAPTLTHWSPRVGPPDVAGPLAVFPLFGPPPRLAYRSFAQAAPLGATVKEMPGGASVNDLVVTNPTDLPLLLYEGEEVLGAQQNRTFDVSVLVPAGAKLTRPGQLRRGTAAGTPPAMPRPCGRRRRPRTPTCAGARAPRCAPTWPPPDRCAPTRARCGGGRGQGGAVRGARADRARCTTSTSTAARRSLTWWRGSRCTRSRSARWPPIGGRCVVLDCVSRPDVFASLHGPLLQGYALDALDAPSVPAPPHDAAEAFAAAVRAAAVDVRDGIGLGRFARFATPPVAGTALLAGDEVVQLTAFAEEHAGWIRRPSQRR